MSRTLVTLVGPVHNPDGTNANGSIDFTPTDDVRLDSASFPRILTTVKVVDGQVFAADGVSPATIFATDDVGIFPPTTGYWARERLGSRPSGARRVAIPGASESVAYGSLADETGTDSGGDVTSVDGQSGVVRLPFTDGDGNLTPTAVAVASTLTITKVSGTAYTVGLADAQSMILFDSDSSVAVTFPLDSDTDFPIGSWIVLVQRGAGQVSAVGDPTFVTFSSAGTAGLNADMTLTKTDTDEWQVSGTTA